MFVSIPRHYAFVGKFAVQYGLLYAAVSFVVSVLFDALTWRAACVGFLIGAVIAVLNVPRVMRQELQEIHITLLSQWILAAMKQCHEQGVELDIDPLHQPVLAATKEQLKTKVFQTVDVDEELST